MSIPPPISSVPIYSILTSCLRKFIVHFRRPPTLKQKSNYPYRGEYGFDWLRDEYIYPIEKVYVDYCNATRESEIGLNDINALSPLCINPVALMAEYRKGVKHPISPYGKAYYPAWLSIFSCDTESKASSTMHKDGIFLTIQLEEIDEITNDGTEIIFRPRSSCLTVTPSSIPISQFMMVERKVKNLRPGPSLFQIKYRELVSVINVKCDKGTLNEHSDIRVFAKLGRAEVEVGKLMVYANKEVRLAKIACVDVITEYDLSGKPIHANISKTYQNVLKNQSFNQALVRVEIRRSIDFDLVKLAKNPKNRDVIDFLNYCKKNKSKLISFYLERQLLKLYQKYGKYSDPSGEGLAIDDDNHTWTYALFCNYNPDEGHTYGITTRNEVFDKWGNICVIFNKGLTDEQTIAHEIGHSFSLWHSFEYGHASHVFYIGFTENIMDYSQKYVPNPKKPGEYKQVNNSYRGKMYSFYKWQWDIIREDRSMEKE